MKKLALALPLFAGLIALPASCLDATALRVNVTTEVDCSATNAEVVLFVAKDLSDLEATMAAAAVSSSRSGCVDAKGAVGDVVITPATSNDQPLAFAVVTRSDGQAPERCGDPALPQAEKNACIVAKRQLRFVSHTTLDVDVALRISCAGVVCGTEETCVKGQCVPAACSGADCQEGSLLDGSGGAGGASSGAGGASSGAGGASSGAGGASTGAGGAGGNPVAGCNGSVDCARYVFAASAVSPALLGGIAGADMICQQLADATSGPLKGRAFWAWLSTTQMSPVKRFVKGTKPYQLPSGAVIANGWAGLTSGSLLHAINETETGAPFNGQVWTDTDPSGNLVDPAYTCNNWNDVGGIGGIHGDGTALDGGWTQLPGAIGCATSLSIYCFER